MKNLFLLSISLSSAAPAMAQTNDDIVIADRKIEEITVLATGLSQPVDETGQSINVVDLKEIEAVQGPDLTRVLQRLPGVTLTRNGGPGGFTGVRVRGADAEQTLVLVDGARVADVSSPGSGFDFGSLVAGGIGRIELLRGSNSVVWGSDAIGGVIAVTTREFDGVEASAEYGARDSFTGTAVAGIARETFGVTLNGGYTRTDGFSALAGNAEPDPFRQWQVGGRAHVELASGLSAFADARYADALAGIDFSFADDYVQTTRLASGRAGLRYAGDRLDLMAAWSLADTRRDYASPGFSYGYQGRNQLAELRGRWQVLDGTALVFGGSHTWDRYEGSFDALHSARQASGYAMLDQKLGGANLAAGLRIDHHSTFGDAWSLGANGSVPLGGEWRLRASYGEGFKAPTLYQLYSFYGNLALQPERSRSADAAVEYGSRKGDAFFAVTVFRRDSRNLIQFDSAANGGWGSYYIVPKTRASGFELEGGVRPAVGLHLQAAYSYVKPVNRTTGRDLYRRPRHALTLSADWDTPLAGLALGADLRVVGKSMDDPAGDTDPRNDVRMKGYALADLRASLPLGERFELFGRIENVTDAAYQMVSGYNTPGRSAYLGARARF